MTSQCPTRMSKIHMKFKCVYLPKHNGQSKIKKKSNSITSSQNVSSNSLTFRKRNKKVGKSLNVPTMVMLNSSYYSVTRITS